jgi:hypothetical protein
MIELETAMDMLAWLAGELRKVKRPDAAQIIEAITPREYSEKHGMNLRHFNRQGMFIAGGPPGNPGTPTPAHIALYWLLTWSNLDRPDCGPSSYWSHVMENLRTSRATFPSGR